MVNNSRFFVDGQELAHARMWWERQSLTICYWGWSLSVTVPFTEEEAIFYFLKKYCNSIACQM